VSARNTPPRPPRTPPHAPPPPHGPPPPLARRLARARGASPRLRAAARAPGAQQPPATHVHLERELRRVAHDLAHDLKSHSIGTTIAGAVVAGAAALFGVGAAALAGLGALVVYRLLARRQRRRTDAQAPRAH
jgi:hypothetical protein